MTDHEKEPAGPQLPTGSKGSPLNDNHSHHNRCEGCFHCGSEFLYVDGPIAFRLRHITGEVFPVVYDMDATHIDVCTALVRNGWMPTATRFGDLVGEL